MLVVLICRDRPGALDLRAATRPRHLAFIAAAGDTVKIAGPLFADDGTTPIGSLIVIAAESLEEARAWSARDPYAEAGLFADVGIHPWSWLVGRPEA